MLLNLFRSATKAIKPRFEVNDMAALMFTLEKHRQGGLRDILQSFLENNLNLTHIESRPADQNDSEKGYTFIVDVETPNLNSLETVCEFIRKTCGEVTLLGSTEVPWFPRKISDIDDLPQQNRALLWDHPGQKDENYISRRSEFARIAGSIKITGKIPKVEYNTEELETWKSLYRAVTPYYKKLACTEYYNNLIDMENRGLIKENEVPQIADINSYLKNKTGFQLKPISALESDRDFLNCLAFRVFPAALHMRHSSQPYFSIDPDIAHEVLGHSPLLADPQYASFLQEIGLASLGASTEDIEKLTILYFYSAELGLLINENEEKKIYGARILSSVDEIEHAISIKPELRHFDPFQACNMKYHRRHLQNIYWFCSDFLEARTLVRRYSLTRPRPFHASFDKSDYSIKVDHKIKTI